MVLKSCILNLHIINWGGDCIKRIVVSLYFNREIVGDFAVPTNVSAYELTEKFRKILISKGYIDEVQNYRTIYVRQKDVSKELGPDETFEEAGVREGNIITLSE